eukprot:13409102-Ditylum_brightwellii.AAC.1
MPRYIMRCTGWTTQQCETIDWENLGRSLESQKLHTQIRLVKFMNDWLSTGTQKHEFYKEVVVLCPICCVDTETWQHLFQCQHTDAVAVHTLAMTKFRSTLIKMKTAPIIRQIIYHQVAHWCKLPCGLPPSVPTDATGALVLRVDAAQVDIGWNNFIKGKIAKD